MSWESISLSDALRPLKSSPFTRDELNYSGGQYQNVHYGDILVRFPSVVDAEKEGLPYVSDSAEGRCSRCSLLQNGDIIIADTAEDEAVGKAIEIQGITDQKVVSGLHTMAFRPQEGLFAPGFLGYFLNSSVYHNQLLPLMQGIKVLSISKTAIGDTVIKYPSYKEQEKIVESLSGVDDMIGALDEAITKKRQIKEGLMQQLLTGKTRLPGFNEEWRICKLKDIAEMFSGGTPSSKEPRYYGGDIQFLSISDMTSSGKYIYTTEKTITKMGLENSSARVFPAGTLMYAMYASLGKCSISQIETAISQAILGFILSDEIDKMYLYYHFCFIEEQVKNMGQTGTQSNLSKALVEQFTIPVPILSEQKAIADTLSTIDEDIYEIELKREKYLSIKQGMMQELLTGKTRL